MKFTGKELFKEGITNIAVTLAETPRFESATFDQAICIVCRSLHLDYEDIFGDGNLKWPQEICNLMAEVGE